MCTLYLYVFTRVTDRRNAYTREIRAPTRDIRTYTYMTKKTTTTTRVVVRFSRYPVRERTGCTVRARCTRTRVGARGRATRENTIKAAPGKNTNLNGTKEICSHIRCIRMNGARLLQFTIYCFATFFSADASGIRSLLPVLCRPPRSSHQRPFRRSRSFLLSFSLGTGGRERDGKVREGRVSEKGRTGTAGRSGR